MTAPTYLPGDRIMYDGRPAVVICGHADGWRLYIRQRSSDRPGSGDDLLVDAATCAPVEPASPPPPPQISE
jgi:hypothetical protein